MANLISLGDYYLAKRHYWRAVSYYTAAIRKDPTSPKAFTGRANAYLNLGEPEKAFEDFCKVLDIDPQPETYNARGIIYQKQKNHNLAILDFGKAIKLNPDIYEAYNNRGYSYVELGKSELRLFSRQDYVTTKLSVLEAVRRSKRKGESTKNRLDKELKKQSWTHWSNFGYESLHDFLQAMPELDILEQKSGNYRLKLNDGVSKIAYFRNNVNIDSRSNVMHPSSPQFLRAIEDFNLSIDKNPKFIEAYKNRAVAHNLVGDNASAKEDLRIVEELIEAQRADNGDSKRENIGHPSRSIQTLSWQLLPPGWWRLPRHRQGIKSEFKYSKEFDNFIERLEFADSFHPRETYVSRFADRGSRYYLFVFQNHVVAECPEYGNAAYVLRGKKDWQYIFKKPKKELQAHFKEQITVIHHSTDWKQRLRPYLN